jgi:uncharacterized protein involved in response to NO
MKRGRGQHSPLPFTGTGAKPFHRISPFFVLAVLDGIVNIATWLAVYFYPAIWPDRGLPAMYWHAHEMLFGFIVAAIAGFLLTAVPGWTGRSAPTENSLVPLAILWLAGRIAMFPVAGLPCWVASFSDLAFLPVLISVLVPPLIRARKIRGLSLIWPLTALFLANLLFHLGLHEIVAPGEHIALQISIDIIVILIVIVAGRIIPAFTVRDLKRRGSAAKERTDQRVEFLSISSIIVMLSIDIAMPLSFTSGLITLTACFAQGLRLTRWRAHPTTPPLSALHLAYAWLVIGLLLKGIWLLTGAGFADKWMHALTIGVFTTMILAVMARLSPAYTGRPHPFARSLGASYGLINVAAIVRVFGPSLAPTAYREVIALSGLCWLAALSVILRTQVLSLTKPGASVRAHHHDV